MKYIDPTGHEPNEVDNNSDWDVFDFREISEDESRTVFLDDLNQYIESIKISNDDGTTTIINKYFPAGGGKLDHIDTKVYNAEGEMVMFDTEHYSNPDKLLDNLAVTGIKATAGYNMGEAGNWVAKEMDKVENLSVSKIVGFSEEAGDILEEVPLDKVAGETGKKVAKSAGFWISAIDFVRNEASIISDDNLSVSQKFHKGAAEAVYSGADVIVGLGWAAGGTAVGGLAGTVFGIGGSTGTSIIISGLKESYFEKHNLK